MNSEIESLRGESPRPDFLRHDWHDLSGAWEFEFDAANIVDGDRGRPDRSLKHTITVPFPHQSAASGIGDAGFYPCMWYRRKFDLDAGWGGRRILLHFGAVDSECSVWVNGAMVGTHTGGYDSFVFDITRAVRPKDNDLLVKVTDDLDPARPRGKQSWGSSFAVWYTPMSGLWQPVWLEAVGELYVRELIVEEANPASRLLRLLVGVNAPRDGARVELVVQGDGQSARIESALEYPFTRLTVELPEVHPWTPATPFLYDLTLRIGAGGKTHDVVESYTGFRTVAISERAVLLNGEATWMRLVLDQGHWRDSLFSPPSGGALRDDIVTSQRMGFNGCRRHIKAEDPRMLYWADRLGYLVWAEFPSPYVDSAKSRASLLREWPRIIARDRNHPSVVAWTTYNESWGIPRVAKDIEVQDWVRSAVAFTRQLDPTRLVIDNDGWEHVATDCLTYHTYAPDGASLKADHESYLRGDGRTRRGLMAGGLDAPVRPVLISEFGGVGLHVEAKVANAWGYGRMAESEKEYLSRVGSLFKAVYEIEGLAGFCYTQFNDVEQETNGLLDATHAPKVPLEEIRRLVLNEG